MQVHFLFWAILARSKGNIVNQFAVDNTLHPFFLLESCSAFPFFFF